MAVPVPLLASYRDRWAGPRPRVDRLPLLVAAAATVAGSVAFDVLAGEHPTHTLGLALVASAVAALRVRLAGRHEGLASVVSAAVVAQPALHAASKLLPPTPLVAHDGVLHVVTADGPTTLVQTALPVAVVLAVAVTGRLAQLLLSALRRPVRMLVAGPPTSPLRCPTAASTQRHGSMLRWCGWSIRAARRGPPVPSGS
jgi:hypothetical protein